MTEPLNSESRSGYTPLTEILEALGEEFFALGQFAEQFQVFLSPALLRVANDPECHRNVQTLDLLSQRLAALSGYVRSISHEVPQDWRVNPQAALHRVSLADLAYRLSGAPVPPQEALQSGVLELF